MSYKIIQIDLEGEKRKTTSLILIHYEGYSQNSIPLCLCLDKDHLREREATDHHQLSIPCSEFFWQLLCYVAASMPEK